MPSDYPIINVQRSVRMSHEGHQDNVCLRFVLRSPYSLSLTWQCSAVDLIPFILFTSVSSILSHCVSKVRRKLLFCFHRCHCTDLFFMLIEDPGRNNILCSSPAVIEKKKKATIKQQNNMLKSKMTRGGGVTCGMWKSQMRRQELVSVSFLHWTIFNSCLYCFVWSLFIHYPALKCSSFVLLDHFFYSRFLLLFNK